MSIEAMKQEPDEPDELTIAYMSGFFDGKKNREWVWLTDEEKEKFVVNYYSSKWDRKAAVVLMNDYEAKLREKNGC